MCTCVDVDILELAPTLIWFINLLFFTFKFNRHKNLFRI